MKLSSFSRLLITNCFLCLLTVAAAAQDFGVTYGGYTSINYDEETNIVTAYSETYPENYELAGDYEAQVNLQVKNEYGVTVASGNGQDYGDGSASVELSFVGEPGRTYTATGIHRALSHLYSYEEDYPHRLFYWDTWYYTPFEAQTVYEPWYYGFYRPTYQPWQRRVRTINLGRTYDTVSIIQVTHRGTIQAQGPDISSQDAARVNGRTCPGVTGVIKGGFRNREGTISWAWARDTIPTKQEAMDALRCIEFSLTATARSHRNQVAFPSAANYIASSPTDGRDREGRGRSWLDPGQAHNRVDITIHAGRAFSGTLPIVRNVIEETRQRKNIRATR